MITCKDNFGNLVTLATERFKFRPSVYGLILNGQGQLCICRNKSDGKIWFPGGGVDIGEKLETALRREINEETGLSVNIEGRLAIFENFYYYQPTDEAFQAFLFFYKCSTDETRLLDNHEIIDGEAENLEWVDIGKINQADLTDLNEQIFALIRSLK